MIGDERVVWKNVMKNVVGIDQKNRLILLDGPEGGRKKRSWKAGCFFKFGPVVAIDCLDVDFNVVLGSDGRVYPPLEKYSCGVVVEWTLTRDCEWLCGQSKPDDDPNDGRFWCMDRSGKIVFETKSRWSKPARYTEFVILYGNNDYLNATTQVFMLRKKELLEFDKPKQFTVERTRENEEVLVVGDIQGNSGSVIRPNGEYLLKGIPAEKFGYACGLFGIRLEQ